MKVAPVELNEDTGILRDIVNFFEEGVVAGKGVLEVTGKDVASFCDELLGSSATYADRMQESERSKHNKGK